VSDLLDMGLEPTGERRSRRGAVVVVLAAVVLIGAVTAGFVVIRSSIGQPAVTDYPGPGAGLVTVTIDPGMSVSEIGVLLAQDGVVKTRQAFVDAASANPKARTIAAGTYSLLHEMKAADAVTYLVGPAHRLSLHVVIPEGFQDDQVLQAIAKTGHITQGDLQSAARNTKALDLPTYSGGKLEGFLFPATYDWEPGTTAQQALSSMVERFNQEATDIDLVGNAAQLKMSPYDIVKIASIVEREGKTPDDYGKIARVIYNRIAKGMPLQMDSTLQYTKAVRTAHLSLQDLSDPSPYNSYTHKGLPPTPIANPGRASLLAALNPEPGNWLYFIAFPDGTTKFTADYNQFLALKAASESAKPSASVKPSSAAPSASTSK
jgi:UPF0755 protein